MGLDKCECGKVIPSNSRYRCACYTELCEACYYHNDHYCLSCKTRREAPAQLTVGDWEDIKGKLQDIDDRTKALLIHTLTRPKNGI